MAAPDVKVMTAYISIWNWHLLAIIFFCFAILFFIIGDAATVFFVAFLAIFAFAEAIAWSKKEKLLKNANK